MSSVRLIVILDSNGTVNPEVSRTLPVNGISDVEYEELPYDLSLAKSSKEISGTVTVFSP